MAILAVNAPVYLEATRDTPITVSALTLADPGVATASAPHGMTTGTIGFFTVTDSAGTVDLNRQACEIVDVDGTDFTLLDLNTTGFNAWTTGTFTPILTWHKLCISTGVDIPNNEPTKVPTTTLCSTREETQIGLEGEISGTVSIHDDPGNTALKEISEQAAGGFKVWRQVFETGHRKIYSAQSVWGGGYSAEAGQVVTSSISLTPEKKIISLAP